MFRGISIRRLAMILCGPAIGCILNFLTLLWLNLQAARSGIPPRQLMMISVGWGVGYVIGAQFGGRTVNQRRAMGWLITAVVGLGAVATSAVFAKTLAVMVGISVLTAIFQSNYMVAIQVGFGRIRPFRTLGWTVGAYLVSSCLGMGVGLLSGGALRVLSSSIAMAIVAGLVLGSIALALLATYSPEPVVQRDQTVAFYSTARQRWMAWIAIFVSCILLFGFFNLLWPAYGVAIGLTDTDIGLSGLVSAGAMVLGVCSCAALRRFLRKPWLLVGGLMALTAAFVVVPLTQNWTVLLICVAVFGFASQFVVYQGVYFSNADPDEPAKSVGMNEAVIGAGAIFGPVLLGLLSWDDPTSLVAFVGGAIPMVVATVVILRLWRAKTAVEQSKARAVVAE
jgi:predicted MFS family arabinose efflux permease